jgi:hypothetical protein
MYRSIPFSNVFGVVAFICAILAILGSIATLISLSLYPIPGKRVHWMMFGISSVNLLWHGLGIGTSFVDSIPDPVRTLHFAIGVSILWIHFMARLEILRLFEAVTLFSSRKVTIWEWISTCLFWGLSMGSWISPMLANPFVDLWATYWVLLWLLYMGGGFAWMQSFITIKLYQHIQQTRRDPQSKGKEKYNALMWKHVLISMWEPLTGTLWVYGWLVEKDQVTQWCMLKVGEAFMTYNILCTILFLKNLKEFTFGQKKVCQPLKIALESRTELFQKTRPMQS